MSRAVSTEFLVSWFKYLLLLYPKFSIWFYPDPTTSELFLFLSRFSPRWSCLERHDSCLCMNLPLHWWRLQFRDFHIVSSHVSAGPEAVKMYLVGHRWGSLLPDSTMLPWLGCLQAKTGTVVYYCWLALVCTPYIQIEKPRKGVETGFHIPIHFNIGENKEIILSIATL